MNFSLVSVLASSLLLSAGCATSSERRERSEQRSDRDALITTSVNNVIVTDEEARFFRIEVNTHNGVVTLRGSIHSRGAEMRLLEKIRDVEGVRGVKSQLRLDGIPS